MIKEGRVLVPVRAITEGMGATLSWDPVNKIITISRDDVTVTMKLGESYITVRDEHGTRQIQMDTLVQINSNRTFVPLRFLAEAFGDRVDYDDDTGDIDVQNRLATPARPTLSSGIAAWTAVPHENDGYRLRLFRNNAEVTRVTIAHGAALTYNFSSKMTMAGIYTVRVRALGTGDYSDSAESVPSMPQIVGVSIPAAPTNPVVDDEANTFGWTYVHGYTKAEHYEYSVNNGSSWKICTSNPQPVGNYNYAAGTVQVRVRADYGLGRPAGEILVSMAAFTSEGQIRLATPAMPTLSGNIAAWTAVPHENDGYRLRLFRNDVEIINTTVAHGAPLSFDFSAYMTQSGIYTVRVRALGTGAYSDSRESQHSLPQLVGISPLPAPTNPVVNNSANTFGWTYVPGYPDLEDYEYTVDNGLHWEDCTANPQPVGNHNFAAGTVQVRIEADFSEFRPAGLALVSPIAFTVN